MMKLLVVFLSLLVLVPSSCASSKEPLTLAEYPDSFGMCTTLVVGSGASQIEADIADFLALELKEQSGTELHVLTDAEISQDDKTSNNLILIGTPGSNQVLAEVYDMGYGTRVTTEYPGESKGILEIMPNPWNEKTSLLIIAGSDEWGVKAGAASLLGSQQQDGNMLVVEWEQSEDKSPSYLSKIDATLDFLLYLRGHDQIPEGMKAIVMKDTVSVSIKFIHELDDSEIHSVEELGVIFKRLNSGVAHSGTIYGADVPWHRIYDLAELESIVRIESTWLPGMEDPDN